MVAFFSREQAQHLLDAGLSDYLTQKIPDHWESVRQRVEQTHIAEGANLEWVRSQPLIGLEYGNIGNGIANPQLLTAAQKTLTLYARGEAYIQEPGGEALIPLTEEVLAGLEKHQRIWSQEDVDRGTAGPGYGDSGNTNYLTPESIKDVIQKAKSIASSDRMAARNYGDNGNTTFRWQFKQLAEEASIESVMPSKNHVIAKGYIAKGY